MFDWFRGLDRDGRRTFWACFGGYALDAMDVQIYSFIVPTLIGLWGMTNTQAGLIATVTLVLSALGGWMAGLLSDRLGRVRTLQITIVWFAVFTFLSGFTSRLRYPVRLEEFSIRRGSGGDGRWRGGDGAVRRLRFLEPMTAVIVSSRRAVAPFGLAGGGDGAAGQQWVDRMDGSRTALGGTDRAEMAAGDVFTIHTPGGGGCETSPIRTTHLEKQ